MMLPFVADDEKAQRNFEELEKRIAALENPPSVRASMAATVTLTTGSFSLLSFGNVIWDPFGMHQDASHTSRFTCPAGLGGLYLAQLHLNVITTAACRVYSQTFLNGSVQADNQPGLWLGTTSTLPLTIVLPPIRIKAGDYLEYKVLQDSGADITLAASTINHLTLRRIGNRP